MSNMLKCPNPSCPYVFDPSQVPVGVVLSCPRCAMQFTLGPPQPATAPPPGQAAPGYPSFPTGQQAPPLPPPPVDPEFEAVGRTAAEDRDPDKILPTRGTNKMQIYVLAGVAVVAMTCTILVIAFKLIFRGRGTVPQDAVTRLHDMNVSIDSAPNGWTHDDTMRVKVGSPFVMSYRRENPEAYMVFGANAFGSSDPNKGKAPRPSDMKTDLEQPFGKLFTSDTFRTETPVASSWLGESISSTPPFPNGYKFRAQSSDGLIWMGEAYTIAYKGIAYYWISWCLESDYEGMKDEFATFRGRFKFLETRKNWKETQANTTDFKGDKTPYTITDTDEVWKDVPGHLLPALRDAEPDLDRRLEINKTSRRDRKALPDQAELSVYILDGGGDPLAEARKYVEAKETARFKAAGDFTVTFTELTDQERGDPVPQSIPVNTPAVRLQTTILNSKSSQRLFVVSGLKVGDKIVVVSCWCELEKRNVFEARFVQIAKSLR